MHGCHITADGPLRVWCGDRVPIRTWSSCCAGNSLGKPLAKHTVKELKELLKAAELPVTGKKAELIDRLIEAGY